MNTLIIMNGNMTELENLCKHYKNVLKTDAELLSDLSDLGWEYTCGRLSRSGMEVYDKIMIKLGVLNHWNTGTKIVIKITGVRTRRST